MSCFDRLKIIITGWRKNANRQMQVKRTEGLMLSAIIFNDTVFSIIAILSSVICLVSLIHSSKLLPEMRKRNRR